MGNCSFQKMVNIFGKCRFQEMFGTLTEAGIFGKAVSTTNVSVPSVLIYSTFFNLYFDTLNFGIRFFNAKVNTIDHILFLGVNIMVKILIKFKFACMTTKIRAPFIYIIYAYQSLSFQNVSMRRPIKPRL